jgi:type VI protein secretion system component Hcp
MLFHWLRACANTLAPRTRRPSQRPNRSRPLGLEVLEDRLTPSTTALLQFDGSSNTGVKFDTPVAVASYNASFQTLINQAAAPTAVQGDFSFSSSSGLQSPALLAVALNGGRFIDAVLTVQNNGQVVQFTFQNVTLTSFASSSGSDSFTLHYLSIKEAANPKQAPALPAATGLPTGTPTQVLQIAGIGDTLGVQSFNWSVLQQTDASGKSYPQPSDFNFNINASVDSPLLLLAGAQGVRFSEAVLTVQGNGQEIQWTLGNVFISSYSSTGLSGGALASDHLTLHFDTIKESVLVSGKTPTEAKWNFPLQNDTNVAADTLGKIGTPVGLAVPTPGGATGTLQLDGNNPLPVFSASWGETYIPGTSGGIGTSQASDLTLQTQESIVSPVLLATLTGNKHFAEAVLTLQAPGTQIQLTLTNVHVVTDSIGAFMGGGAPSESVTLHFDAIQESVTTAKQTVAQGWDFKAHKPTSLTPLKASTLPVASTPNTGPLSIVLQLKGLAPVSVSSYSYGFSNPTAGNGMAVAADLHLQLTEDALSPQLLQDLAAGMQFSAAVLTASINGETFRLDLGNVVIDALNLGGAIGGDSPSESLSLHYDQMEEAVMADPHSPILFAAWDFMLQTKDITFARLPAPAAPISAVTPTQALTATIQLDGQAPLSVASFSGGFSAPPGIGGGVGRALASNLFLQLLPTAHDPLFLADVAAGAPFSQVVLNIQVNGEQFQFILTNVNIQSYSTGGVAGAGAQGASISLSYDVIQEIVVAPGGQKVSAGWDFKMNKALTNAQLQGATTSGAAAGITQSSGATISVQIPGAATPLPVSSYSWALSKTPTTLPAPSNFLISIPEDQTEPTLLADILGGKSLGQVVLTAQYGGEVVTWTLTNVTISSLRTSNGVDNLSLHFDTIQESVTPTGGKAVVSGWDFVVNKKIDPKSSQAGYDLTTPAQPPAPTNPVQYDIAGQGGSTSNAAPATSLLPPQRPAIPSFFFATLWDLLGVKPFGH